MRIRNARHLFAVICGTVFVVAGLTATPFAAADTTALEEYVFSPDPAYEFKLQQTVVSPGYTLHVLLMNSLRWRSTDEVDRTLWTHQIAIIVPDTVSRQTALTIIDGGRDPNDPPDDLIVTLAAAIATSSQSIIAAVSQIPNQPLLFVDESSAISEDALVAYSWDKAMLTGDAVWAAYMPMVKAAVRGLDTIQTFVNDSVVDVQIDDFVVTGFSKRGAAAWLVAAVDPRVRAVAPGVFDVLDMPVQIERHYQAYGFYSSAIEDYANYDVLRRVRSPEGQFLLSIVDPLSYTATLDIPKLLLNATGDQFFLPDAATLYAPQLPGETLIRQVPNTDHGFENGLLQALDSLLAWYKSVLDNEVRPAVSWQLDKNGSLLVTSEPPPASALLWQADNPNARDFRLETIGPVWTDSALPPSDDGAFEIALTAPAQGYRGYLVELVYPGGAPVQTYTTPVFVAPDVFEFVLDDPVGAARSSKYWACQIPDTNGCPSAPDITPAQLEGLLPFPLFGEYITSIDQLADALTDRSNTTAQARSDCAATRLNIAAGELGWYSGGNDPDTPPLWMRYQRAEEYFDAGNPAVSTRVCAALNLPNDALSGSQETLPPPSGRGSGGG